VVRVQFGLLGPLLVIGEDGEAVPVDGGRLRVLLAALLLQAGTPVSAERLAEVVWDGAPPAAAARTLRSHVRRLRRVLGSEFERVTAHQPGYLIRVAPAELDVLEFARQCQVAGAALREGAWQLAADAAAGALRLWRGQPLLDVPSQLLRDAVGPQFERLRIQAQEDRAEAGLHLGQHERLLADLHEMVAAHPLRERFRGQLMLALYRSGRQAEALAAYQHAREVLAEELGADPGPDLRRLHARILAADDALAAPRSAVIPAARGGVESTAPRQLPSATRHFTGRGRELELIINLTGPQWPEEDSGAPAVITAIDGMAGIGKTALAVQAAHRLADRYPDGQLFLDLRGHTQGQQPRTVDEALAWLLQALGVPPGKIPADTDRAAALYRQRLTGTRTLIVLDNAASEAQVRPLLPGGGPCQVLVTSRRRLKALDDARVVSLDVLPAADAVALLRAIASVGPDAARDRLLGEVSELCGRLPLALRIAGALLRHRPSWSVERLAGQLRQHQRLRALSDGDRDLSAAFDLSYASIGPQRRCLWRRLGLIPGPNLDAHAAAALLNTDQAEACDGLQNLVDHNLLAEYAPGRYRLHDLLREHARTLAAAEPAAEREAAMDRLLTYYAQTGQRASMAIARNPRLPPDSPVSAHAPVLAGRDAARGWLRTELANVDAALAHARDRRLDRHTVALAAALAEILQADGPFARAVEIHQEAAAAAERLGSPAAQASALTDLGRARRVNGDHPGAISALVRAVQMCRQLGERLGEANAVNDLGRVRQVTGDYPGAHEALTRALELYRTLGERLGEANALSDLGRVRYMTGAYRDAAGALSLALEIHDALGNPYGAAYALTNLGRVSQLTGDLTGAADAYTRSLQLYRALGSRLGEATALYDLGRVRQVAGDYHGARDALTRALALHRALGGRLGEANALTDLGGVRRLTGDYPGAEDALTVALAIYRALGNRPGEAYALAELGRVRQATGDYVAAAEALAEAVEISCAVGDPSNEAWALNHYAAALAAGDHDERALALYQRALEMNRGLGKPDDEAISLEGIAELRLAAGDLTDGADRLHEALVIYRRLGMAPDTVRVENRLGVLTRARRAE
jgi:DNA-binding SARP family transcriptional activator